MDIVYRKITQDAERQKDITLIDIDNMKDNIERNGTDHGLPCRSGMQENGKDLLKLIIRF